MSSAIAGGLGLLCGWLAWQYGLNQFPGYDASPMIDLAWRQVNGLRSHIDFFSPFPPTFGYPLTVAFEQFGVRWSTVIALNALACALAVMAGAYWWSRVFGYLSAVIVFGLGALQSMVYVGFWWHNSIGTMLALLSASGMLALLHKKASPWAVAIVLGFALASKPNCTWPLLLGLFAASLTAIHARGDVIRHAVLWLVAVAVALMLAELDGSAIGYFRDLAQIAQHRGTSTFGWNSFLGFVAAGPLSSTSGIGMVVSALAGVSFLLLSIKDYGARAVASCHPEIRLGLVASFAGSMALNNEAPLVAWPLLTAALLAQPSPVGRHSRMLVGMVSLVLFVPAACALREAHDRERVRTAGEGTFWQVPERTGLVSAGFLAGTVASQRLAQFNDEVQTVLTRYPSAKVFFGPRVEYAYAAFAISPAAGLPLWWDRHQSWPFQDKEWSDRLERNWRHADFDLLVFNRAIYSYRDNAGGFAGADMYDIPDFIRRDIRARYTDVSGSRGLQASVILMRSDRQPAAGRDVPLPRLQGAGP